MIGGSGLQVVINDNIAIYLTDDSPNGEKRYRARFYFDPNAIEMAALDRHNILLGYSTLSQPAMLIELRYVANPATRCGRAQTRMEADGLTPRL